MSSVKISAVIITFNEERNISRCIDSLQDVVDEILVVDSYSKDKTKQICLEKGVTFMEHAFEGHIQQKNWAKGQAKFDHVLSLDADEALSEELKDSIKQIKMQFIEDGYSFNRLTNYCGKWIKHCGWYPDVKLRLWDRNKGKWTGVNPHDKFELNQGCKSHHLKGDLLHYSYYTIDDHLNQYNKFTTIGAAESFKRGKSISVGGILVKTIWKFVRDYFIKAGILDGYYGFVISANSAHATFTKYVKLKELNKNAKKKQ